jgi:hypothetical protein
VTYSSPMSRSTSLVRDELQIGESFCSTSPMVATGYCLWIFLTASCAAAYAAPPTKPGAGVAG